MLKNPTIKGRLNDLYTAYVYWRQCVNSRKKAVSLRKQIIARKGQAVVDRELKKQIKKYCRSVFGSAVHWPWLAVYTELMGVFKEGWIPSELLTLKILPALNPRNVSWIGMQKTMTYRILGDKTVRPLLILVDRMIYDADFNLVSDQQANQILKNHNAEVVIKQDEGYGGHQVRFAESSEINLANYLGKANCVIQPGILQHASLEKVYPRSVNTIRVITYIDSDAKIAVLCLKLKFGALGARVDNTSPAGRFVYLDADGNFLTDVYKGSTLETETHHPDTGYEYKNLVVPSVRQVMDLCVKAHLQYPYIAIIGWDVYIGTDGNPGIIEWNTLYPGLWWHEAFMGPLFDIRELRNRVKF